jgi:hypothetical protein
MKNQSNKSNSVLFDENRMVLRQKRAINIKTIGADFLAGRICEDFRHRLNATNRQFDKAGDFYSFSEQMSSTLENLENVGSVVRYELPGIAQLLSSNAANPIFPMSLNNLESPLDYTNLQQNWPEKLDLVVSIMGLHSCNDLPMTMTRLFQTLKSDGLLLIALPISGTLNELRDSLTRAELELSEGATIRIDSFIDIQQAGSLLQSVGFKLPVVDREEVIVRYDDIYALISDLRAMGMTSALKLDNTRQPHRELFKRANELYQENHADGDGRIRVSFNYANLTAWAPHENQQKPLKPGSARTSLAKHLKFK